MFVVLCICPANLTIQGQFLLGLCLRPFRASMLRTEQFRLMLLSKLLAKLCIRD